MKAMVIALIVAAATVAGAPEPQTYVGSITDDTCAGIGHARMRMGPTDRECTLACVEAHGSPYVLYDGKTSFRLKNQRQPEAFAGQRVRILGTLDTKTNTIDVVSISPEK